MRPTLIIIVILTLSFACRRENEVNKFVYKPTPESLSQYSKQNFDEAFFAENYYSYSEWAKVDNAEKLTGAFIDATTGKTILDVTKYFYSAETFVVETGDTTFMRTCKATLTDSSLKLVLNDDPFSQRNTELEIIKSGDNFRANYVETAVPTDSSYKSPIYKILKQKVLLDKLKYVKGDNLKGKLSVTIKAFYPTIKMTDTIKIFGLLKTTVD